MSQILIFDGEFCLFIVVVFIVWFWGEMQVDVYVKFFLPLKARKGTKLHYVLVWDLT